MATLSRIAVYPIKSLDPVALDRVGFTPAGGLEDDRAWAIVDADGDYVNGKRTDAVHRLRADVDLDGRRVTLDGPGPGAPRSFDLAADRAAMEAWLGDYFGYPVELQGGRGGAQTDSVVYGDEAEPGATLISAGTLREVASWFDGIDPPALRDRLRPNLVIEGVPAFWEDRLVADGGRRFRIGDATLAGIEPIPRCVVPTRDPTTGEAYEGFRETFVERRAATMPDWADPDVLGDNPYQLMVLVRPVPTARDRGLAVGDAVRAAAATQGG